MLKTLRDPRFAGLVVHPNNTMPHFNAGYVTHRGCATVYIAAEQGLDGSLDAGGKYAIICEKHSTLVQTNDKRTAIRCAAARDFCECCMGTCGDGDDTPCSNCHAEKQAVYPLPTNGKPAPTLMAGMRWTPEGYAWCSRCETRGIVKDNVGGCTECDDHAFTN